MWRVWISTRGRMNNRVHIVKVFGSRWEIGTLISWSVCELN
jgi:hypothetical protein